MTLLYRIGDGFGTELEVWDLGTSSVRIRALYDGRYVHIDLEPHRAAEIGTCLLNFADRNARKREGVK